VDWANEFSILAKRVTLIHRRDQFRAVQTSVEEMKRNKVDIKTFYELKELTGKACIESATIFDNRTGKEETIPVDAIIINIGFVINLDFLKSWGLKMEINAITVNEKMETNLGGCYAAGDIAAHPAKLKLIATGAAEAATAVNFAVTFINPSAKAFPGHSSNLNLSI
jgi:thioredoxin reductase (NADPH)